MNSRFSVLALVFCLPFSLFAQEITFNNPSFDLQSPRASTTPTGWINCGAVAETPPDIQPNPTFHVTDAPADGQSYLGLVSRDNETTESIAQRLNTPVEAGSCYQFPIYLARADSYISPSRKTLKIVNFNEALVLRVWGGNSGCDKRELFFESPLIEHVDWQQYIVNFTPSSNFKYIILEAYYQTPVLFPYNGNILIDNLGAIVSCDVALVEDPLEEPVEEPVEEPKDPVEDPIDPVEEPKIPWKTQQIQ